MEGFENLRESFNSPGKEYSAMPFWFLNDRLDENKLIQQLDDFNSKGIHSVVIHPRMGIPSDTPYLGDRYMSCIKTCVSHAQKLGMKVVIYDEGMYPSGSACGLVAKENPRYRSRGIYAVRQYGKEVTVPENDRLIATYLLKFEDNRLVDFTRAENRTFSFGYVPYAFICGYTGGKIRGVHPDTDDTEENAPDSGDLLGAASVNAFIRITYERYYNELKEFFGTTVTGFFTDEPEVMGRRSNMPPYAAWTEDFYNDFIMACGGKDLLPYLLFDGAQTKEARAAHRKAVAKRLNENYYGKLRSWCDEHKTLLFGHPAQSGDIFLEQNFSVPGQDIVWRMIEPSNNLTSPDSVAAKCSADSARHLSRRRNSNEVFGVCGKKDNPWDFTYSDMLWYLNHLFVRGVNLIIPHAFYYSVRTPLQFSERPPDVGPNNIWWEEYSTLSNYIARLSYINTDARNSPFCAVLCNELSMPYKCVKPLYENQIPFNYVTEDMLSEGRISSNGYSYSVIIVENEAGVSESLKLELDSFRHRGGSVIYADSKTDEEFISLVSGSVKKEFSFETESGDASFLRIEKLTKEGCSVYLLCNESDADCDNFIIGELKLPNRRRLYRGDGFSGRLFPVYSVPDSNGSRVRLKIAPCRLVVLVENMSESPYSTQSESTQATHIDFKDYTAGPLHTDENGFPEICYTGNFIKFNDARYVMHFPQIRDKAKIYINGIHVDTLLMCPWKTDITDYIYRGNNKIEVRVTGSAANIFGKRVPVGFIEKEAENAAASDSNPS